MVSEASTTTAIYRVGADIGGTFTDVVLIGSDGTLATRKVSSTPESFGRAVIRGVDELLTERGIDRDALDALAHASTVATNAILEQKGAVTALVTTEGFRDVLEMRRLRIPVLYDLQYRKPAPLAPRRLRLEVSERIGPGGAVWKPLDEESVVKAARELRRAGVQSVAVAFLHSYANPVHEHRAAEILRQHLPDDVFIVCSTDVLPEIREYERTSTAVVSAYIGPTVEDYLARLQAEMRATGIGAPLQIMQSNGGVMSLEGVRRKPAAIVESGPAAGVIACARLAEALGIANAISFDMGGTTAKSAMIEDGKPSMTTEYEVGAGINLSSKLVKGGGYPIKLPFIDVSEIGSGGGSIVAIDETGALKVGPASAGAAPGPVCYGAGGEQPTFTDAVLTLGYLNQSSLAGGAVRLDAQRSFAVFEDKVARPLGLSRDDAAFGVFTIAAATMTRAVKAVTTYRGRDPRDFVLVAFGGNGPVAAAAVARALSIRTVLIPPAPGVFSALGILMSKVEHEFSSSPFRSVRGMTDDAFEASVASVEAKALADMAEEGHRRDEVTLSRQAELRYSGQAYELSVPFEPGESLAAIAARFRAEHRKTYGHGSEADDVDLVTIRVYARVDAVGETWDYAKVAESVSFDSGGREARRRAYFGPDAGYQDTPVIGRGGLTPEWRVGPLIVEEYDSTCVVPPGARARLDALRNIEIQISVTDPA